MSQDPEKDFVRVNKIIGKQASVGPIPANQILPWCGFAVLSYFLTNGLFSFGLPSFLVVTFWLTVSWWLLTGNSPYLFTDGFRNPPGKEWCNGNAIYISPLEERELPETSAKRRKLKVANKAKTSPSKSSNIRIKLKPVIVPNPKGGKDRFMPFQNESNLCCFVEFNKAKRRLSAILLNNGDQYQLIFGFRTKGLHDLLSSSEVSAYAASIEEGMKELPPGEKITFCSGCYGEDDARQEQLDSVANKAQSRPASVLIRNEQTRVQELTQKGLRQVWEQTAFATWTADSEGQQNTRDLLGKTIDTIKNRWHSLSNIISGDARHFKEQFFLNLFTRGFEEGFIRWELLLNTKMGLDVSPMSASELWEWTWQRFNSGKAPPIPQLIKLEETSDGSKITEIRTTNKHACTILIEGQNGTSSCPEHKGNRSRIYLPGKGKECGILTMNDSPSGWSNTRQQLKWIWEVMSSPHFQNSEVWVEISNGNSYLISDNLARQARQSKTASNRALVKGQGRDIGSEIKQEESFDAQRKIFKGAKALNCAVAFLVYRDTAPQLSFACSALSNSFGSAKVIREKNITWEIWLQCLPITWRWLLHSGSFLSERRLTFDTETVAGILPLTVPRDLDKSGVEFVTERGGKPVFVDLFHSQVSRCLVTGGSGSGKSVVGWRFVLEALANNIPVVGMDVSAGSNSTFKTAIELLGDDGAYYDISQGSSNLMEPPDLRKFDKKERTRRMDSWKESIRYALLAISMGKINHPHLTQRVDGILLRMLDAFLKDPEIIERYNKAFEKGWKSPDWQQIPILSDLMRYCSKERLNLGATSDLDNQAINQIQSQVNALLTSRLGKAVGRPSTFSPEPAVKFFALSGITNEQDSYLMAISAHSACIRNALSHPRTLFIGDELSVLLRKEGFATIVGELCATGRKDGISIVLLSQDIDTIAECATGSQIMQNMVYRITGRVTSDSVYSFKKYLGYDPSVISQNASEAFLPKTSQLYSCWLVETGGRFWRTRFYPAEMLLASVANEQSEKAARNRVMARYPHTLKGMLQGLRHFTNEYIPALKEGKGFDHIGRETAQNHILVSNNGKNNSHPLVT